MEMSIQTTLPDQFTHRDRTPSSHTTGRRVGPTASPDIEETNVLSLYETEWSSSPWNWHATRGFFHPSSLYAYSKPTMDLIYYCAAIWFSYILIYTWQSIISSTSADTSNRTHLVNMATSFSTQLFLLPQHIPQRENSNHGNHNYHGVTHMKYCIQGHCICNMSPH